MRTASLFTVLICLVLFDATLPAQTGSVLLTMTEVSSRPLDGLTVNGISFHFSVGGNPSADATYNAANGGQLRYVQDPSLEGNANGVLQIDFASPVASLQFGLARNTGALSPGAQVQLFDAALNSIGVFPVDTQVFTGFGEALFASNVSPPIGRAVVTFPNAAAASRFSIDNMLVRFIDHFRVGFFSNVIFNPAHVINITNTGAQNTLGGALTNLCVNVYVFAPDEQMLACCACNVTPNALVSLSVRDDLIITTLTPAVPNSIVVKLLASYGAACNAATVTPSRYAAGLAAWGTTLHAVPAPGGAQYRATETPLKPAALSPAELSRITAFCGFIQMNGSGYGICRSCRLGGQSAVRQ